MVGLESLKIEQFPVRLSEEKASRIGAEQGEKFKMSFLIVLFFFSYRGETYPGRRTSC